MFENRIHRIPIVLACIAVLVSACTSPAQNESAIATAVAQTVQAEATEIPPLPTGTSDPALLVQPTLTQAITPTSEATLISAPSDPDCIHAELTGEYPPDRTVLKPNTSFTKTWTIKNVGTCTWDTSYQLINLLQPAGDRPTRRRYIHQHFSAGARLGGFLHRLLEVKNPLECGIWRRSI
jgi:hypothetical protein